MGLEQGFLKHEVEEAAMCAGSLKGYARNTKARGDAHAKLVLRQRLLHDLAQKQGNTRVLF